LLSRAQKCRPRITSIPSTVWRCGFVSTCQPTYSVTSTCGEKTTSVPSSAFVRDQGVVTGVVEQLDVRVRHDRQLAGLHLEVQLQAVAQALAEAAGAVACGR
jgi:hypothetical protein